MPNYVLTVFEHDGEKLLDEIFEAANDTEARKIGNLRLRELNFAEKIYRCASSNGKLLLFHS